MNSGPNDEPDGRRPDELDEGELYVVVRSAVEDAILSVIGTLFLLGLALGIVWSGAAVVAADPSPATFGIGGALIILGFLLAAWSLDLLPFNRDVV